MLSGTQRKNRRRKERNMLRSATNVQLEWFREKVRGIAEIYEAQGLRSKVPIMDFKNAIFQHSTNGFIRWKAEVDHAKLEKVCKSMEDCTPKMLTELKDRLGMLYTVDTLMELENHDGTTATRIKSALRKQVDALECLLDHPRTKEMLRPLSHADMRQMEIEDGDMDVQKGS